jgi:hypothetical protein
MNWKGIKKLILVSIPIFILIVIVVFFIPAFWLGCLSYCPPNPNFSQNFCPQHCTGTNIFFAPIIELFGIGFYYQYITLALVFSIVIWYLLSLVIVWLYYKIKKKKSR